MLDSTRAPAATEALGGTRTRSDRSTTVAAAWRWKRRRIASIALIGPDGAGKTTLTRMLARSGILPFRYLYMGIDVKASNHALLTSRLARRWKDHAHARRSPGATGGNGRRTPGALIWGAGRLLNRVADEWYRQLISWYLQRRGYVVLYDRHFRFDFGPGVGSDGTEATDQRLHRWLVQRFFPQPDAVIFLDAPGAVLFARKGESTAEELERRRQAFLRIGAEHPRFVRVDATRPLDEVYADVTSHIVRLDRASAGPAEAC